MSDLTTRDGVNSFVTDMTEVVKRLNEIYSAWGKNNVEVLIAHRCSFKGVRSEQQKMKIVGEVLANLKAAAAELPKEQ